MTNDAGSRSNVLPILFQLHTLGEVAREEREVYLTGDAVSLGTNNPKLRRKNLEIRVP